MEVKIKKLHKDAVIPTKATKGAAAYDVYTPKSYTILEGRRMILPLGFSIELPYGYEAKIEPRSGFSAKGFEGRYVEAETGEELVKRYDADVIIGKIDSDYRGEVGVIVKSNETFIVNKGTRIAQMTIYKVEDAEFELSEELSDTERADGGFGHTGTK